MLPPIDKSILQNNPKFALLHASLTTNILNGDGSTKHHPAQKERDEVTAELKVARLRAAKTHLLRSALSDMDLTPQPAAFTTASTTSRLKPQAVRTSQTTTSPLPAELIELILLLSSHLSDTNPSPTTLTLLSSSPLWASSPAYMPQISTLISTHLNTLILALLRIHSPSTNASYLHRSIPKLVSLLTAQKEAIAQQKTTLQILHLSLVNKTNTLLSLLHMSTSLSILHLEQTKHGLLSRHLRARSDYLLFLAQQVQYSVMVKRMQGEKMVYTAEVKSALAEYMRGLRSGRERLGERGRNAERVLRGYGVGREGGGEKERVMREIARRWREVSREVREVQRDVGRLRGK